MKTASLPNDEELRLLDLYAYEILDTAAEKAYDDLIELAAQLCNCPISLITLVDTNRQWFKAKLGLTQNETSRSVAFCSHTILSDSILEVENALDDERFSDNPLVTGEPNIRFYAGYPIISPTGHRLGSVCVIDNKPGKLTPEQVRALEIISKQVSQLMDLRAKNKLLRTRATELLELKNKIIQKTIVDQDENDQVIATELHEQIAQKLAACRLYMDMAEEGNELKARFLHRSKSLMTETLNDIRALTKTIAPFSFSSVPGELLMSDYFEQARLIYNFTIEGHVNGITNDENIDQCISCFRILAKWLEILSGNSTVKKVTVVFKISCEISLSIADDGTRSTADNFQESLLTSLLYNRIELAGGDVQFANDVNSLNIITVKMPVRLQTRQLKPVR